MFRHSRLGRLAILALSGILVMLSLSCSGDDPAPRYAVTGLIVDSDGAPVAGARVAIEYTWTQTDALPAGIDDADSVSVFLVFANDNGDPWTLTLVDFRGTVIRVYEGEGAIGSTIVEWPGTDSVGRRVPDGVYDYRLEIGDDTATSSVILDAKCPTMITDDAYLVLTDSDGRFSIEEEWIPFDVELDRTDETGAVTGTVSFDGDAAVCAWSSYRSGTVPAQLSPNREASMTIVIQ